MPPGHQNVGVDLVFKNTSLIFVVISRIRFYLVWRRQAPFKCPNIEVFHPSIEDTVSVPKITFFKALSLCQKSDIVLFGI